MVYYLYMANRTTRDNIVDFINIILDKLIIFDSKELKIDQELVWGFMEEVPNILDLFKKEGCIKAYHLPRKGGEFPLNDEYDITIKGVDVKKFEKLKEKLQLEMKSGIGPQEGDREFLFKGRFFKMLDSNDKNSVILHYLVDNPNSVKDSEGFEEWCKTYYKEMYKRAKDNSQGITKWVYNGICEINTSAKEKIITPSKGQYNLSKKIKLV
jgi:hypothetical protein